MHCFKIVCILIGLLIASQPAFCGKDKKEIRLNNKSLAENGYKYSDAIVTVEESLILVKPLRLHNVKLQGKLLEDPENSIFTDRLCNYCYKEFVPGSYVFPAHSGDTLTVSLIDTFECLSYDFQEINVSTAFKGSSILVLSGSISMKDIALPELAITESTSLLSTLNNGAITISFSDTFLFSTTKAEMSETLTIKNTVLRDQPDNPEPPAAPQKEQHVTSDKEKQFEPSDATQITPRKPVIAPKPSNLKSRSSSKSSSLTTKVTHDNKANKQPTYLSRTPNSKYLPQSAKISFNMAIADAKNIQSPTAGTPVSTHFDESSPNPQKQQTSQLETVNSKTTKKHLQPRQESTILKKAIDNAKRTGSYLNARADVSSDLLDAITSDSTSQDHHSRDSAKERKPSLKTKPVTAETYPQQLRCESNHQLSSVVQSNNTQNSRTKEKGKLCGSIVKIQNFWKSVIKDESSARLKADNPRQHFEETKDKPPAQISWNILAGRTHGTKSMTGSPESKQ